MIPFDDTDIVDVEYTEIDSRPEVASDSLPWLERKSGQLLNWLGKKTVVGLGFLFKSAPLAILKLLWTLVTELLIALVKGIGNGLGKIFGKFTAIAIVIAVAIGFFAFGLSLSETFSWEGLSTIYETWK